MSYEIVRLLAEGGKLFSVWLGKTSTGVDVAIKRFNSSVVNINAKAWRKKSAAQTTQSFTNSQVSGFLYDEC